MYVSTHLNHVLGTYQYGLSGGYVTDKEGNIVFLKSVLVGGVGGILGNLFASPLFLIKTHMQAQAVEGIAVGHQHNHQSSWSALKKIFREHGVSINVDWLNKKIVSCNVGSEW